MAEGDDDEAPHEENGEKEVEAAAPPILEIVSYTPRSRVDSVVSAATSAATDCDVAETREEFEEHLERATTWATGPHDKSNWLVKDRVLVGGWPYRLPKGRGSKGESEEEGEAKLLSILQSKVCTFVSLTEKAEIRSQPYCYSTFKSRAEVAYSELHGPRRVSKRGGRELRFFACPMPDGSVGPDEALARLLTELLKEVSEKRTLYIHCYGGHGRTGIVGCALLCLLYRFGAAEAVDIFNKLHGARVEHGVGGPGQFPHDPVQFEQVERVAALQGPFARFDKVNGCLLLRSPSKN